MTKTLCALFAVAILSAAVPAVAGNMGPDEARRFVVGNLLDWPCSNGRDRRQLRPAHRAEGFLEKHRHTFAGLPSNLLMPGLIHGGWLMLVQYRLGFELRRSDVVIMAASAALVVLMVFSL